MAYTDSDWRFSLEWTESQSGFDYTAATTGAVVAVGGSAEDVAAAIHLSIVDDNPFDPVITDATIARIHVFNLATSEEGDYINAGSLTDIGGATSGDFEPAYSAVITWRTAHPGRRGRGRWYLPFCPESEITYGLFSGVLVEATNEHIAAMLSTWESNGTPLAVNSGTDEELYLVTSGQMQAKAGIQRRRQERTLRS